MFETLVFQPAKSSPFSRRHGTSHPALDQVGHGFVLGHEIGRIWTVERKGLIRSEFPFAIVRKTVASQVLTRIHDGLTRHPGSLEVIAAATARVVGIPCIRARQYGDPRTRLTGRHHERETEKGAAFALDVEIVEAGRFGR